MRFWFLPLVPRLPAIRRTTTQTRTAAHRRAQKMCGAFDFLFGSLGLATLEKLIRLLDAEDDSSVCILGAKRHLSYFLCALSLASHFRPSQASNFSNFCLYFVDCLTHLLYLR